MSSDMDLLKTDSTKRILENLNILTTIDLNGIIFPSEIETGLSLLSQLSVTLRESVDVPQVEGIGTTEGSSEGQPLISPEIDELNTLIREEATLQRALSLESKALMTRGSFIPLLKYDMGPPVAKEPSDEIV